MKKKKKKMKLEGDLSFLAIIVLILLCLMFIGNGASEQWGLNILMFCAGSVAFLVTYFFSITSGLMVDLIVLFGYVTYILYEVIQTGGQVDASLYFWIIWIPAMTVAIHFFTLYTNRVQKENEGLKRQVEDLALRDEATGLENLYSFENTCIVYMRIAERYKMSLVMIVWELRYEKEVRRLLGKQKFEENIQIISKVARKTLREEDSLFLLQDSPYLWGTILFTNEGGEARAISRLKEGLEKEWEKRGGERVQLELRFGTTVYQEGERIPLKLLENARKRLSYDV